MSRRVVADDASDLVILQVSDSHLAEGGARHHDVVDTVAALRRVLRRASGPTRTDVVAVCGDVSDDGSAASYAAARDIAGRWADEHGARLLFVMGNHDDRGGFESVLGPATGVATVRGVRFVRLDSAVAGAGFGSLGGKQLARLRAVLAEPAANGTVLVLHHPPIPAVTPLLRALELQDRDEFADVIAGTDTRLVLAGHYHHPLVGAVRGIPVVVAPGVVNTTDTFGAPGHERAVVGSGGAVVTLPLGAPHGHDPVPATASGRETRFAAPTARFFTAPSAQDGREVFDLDADRVRRIATQAGAPG